MRLGAFLKSVGALIVARWESLDWKSRGMTACGITLAAFAAGSVVTASVVQGNQAASDRVFELRIYHAVPGKLLALEARFRDTTSKLLAKHALQVVGYWVAEDPSPADHTLNNTFVFLVAHPNREAAKKNWQAMWTDPGFQELLKSEQADKTVEKIDATYMRPTDFSPLK
jgi:NIPSNAP